MSYTFKGVLRGRVGPGEVEALSDVTVRLYRLPGSAGEARQAEEFAVLSEQQEREKDFLLIAMGRTDERGEFQIDLSERSVLRPGIPVAYAGEPFQVDVYCRRAPGQSPQAQGREVQFTLGTLRPQWPEGGGTVEVGRELTESEWGAVRAALDAWVICGRVVAAGRRDPQPGARVKAFDADLLQDDSLGTAVTDARGCFRIDYSSRDFRDTPTGVGYERGGPEVYFRVESPGGEVLLDEKRFGVHPGGRKNVGGCLYVELAVAPPVDMPMPTA